MNVLRTSLRAQILSLLGGSLLAILLIALACFNFLSNGVQSYRSFMSRLQARISTQDRSARDHTRVAQAAREGDPTAQDYLTQSLAFPSGEFWFGIDDLGRDFFTRVVYGARVSLSIGFAAAGFSVLIGIPLGILSARSNRLRSVLMPLLDIMQTMPSFVYLIPVLMLFGLGKVPAIFATVIYAAPPLIRLTDLGIRQVDGEVMEAINAFGANRWQQLFGVQLPLALPSIMAGINQTTMMALSMVVIASMIGARGLGEDVLVGIQTLNVGRGLEAGLAIVILAVVIDRITQAYGRPRHEASK